MALKHLKVAHVHVFSSDIDKNVKKQIEQNWGPEVFLSAALCLSLSLLFVFPLACLARADKEGEGDNVPNAMPPRFYDDLMARDNDAAPPCDLYIAGFPCQSFSSAGHLLLWHRFFNFLPEVFARTTILTRI